MKPVKSVLFRSAALLILFLLLASTGEITGAENQTSITAHQRTKEFLGNKDCEYRAYTDNPRQGNRVYLFFYPDGKQIDNFPIPVDQNTVFMIVIVALKADADRYSIQILEGEYAPSYLSLLPPAKEAGFKMAKDDALECIMFERGPFTTERFRFNIAFEDTTEIKVEVLQTHSIRINKLYHAGFGVSFVSSKLQNPIYDVAPLDDTNNTIIALNDGSRGMVTINAIWYWPVLNIPDAYKVSRLIQGRDILASPAFYRVWELTFPTFGVSLNKEWRSNFFFGLAYEFMRGAHLTFGAHYGEVTRLADEDFMVGRDIFDGTKSDIKTNQVWETDWYVGLTIDTHIFKAIIGYTK